MSLDPANIFVATLIACVGLWWFDKVLPSLRTKNTPMRLSLYAGIWLAYFVVIMILIDRTAT
ncbi:MAG: hypothetical protein AAFY83_09960 [Pseudomonadota bacterium]